ncbi:hypothetical protein PR001_g20568 [Phytophthora rubi]|uniref:ARS-binding protein 1 N-terminal domain-containing protein n=1 Tax=Phytophthora rubi TaxID=129364 RepID=A0A6A3JK03_9STRA|nr:hypothetical protein PR001_g20568 [Phytophthora rubi]
MPRASLTKAQQLQLCDYHRSHPRMKCMALAQWCQGTFDLDSMPGKSTVSKILRDKEKLRNVDVDYRDVRRMRSAEMRLLERNILETLALNSTMMGAT